MLGGVLAAPNVALLLALGFGIKAGAVVLHVWLPLAHTVAPTPASAVLSGSMIKAGLLGWIRFLPSGGGGDPAWGAVFIAGGITAAFYGVAVGLGQRPLAVHHAGVGAVAQFLDRLRGNTHCLSHLSQARPGAALGYASDQVPVGAAGAADAIRGFAGMYARGLPAIR